MGRKKPFINKKDAQRFFVVHRSQLDPRANDPDASKYVLVSADKPIEIDPDRINDEAYDSDDDDDDLPDLIDPSTGPVQEQKKPKSLSSTLPITHRRVRFGGIEVEDMVDENGLPRDGYDYSQHMKEMGHGKFYSADGQFASLGDLSRRIELPEEVLPSAERQDRLLEAITLTMDTMDEDLREALVNDDAFEELDDNFVVQAAAEEASSGDDFDYDAHIAKLMAAASGAAPSHRLSFDEEGEDDDEESDEYDELSDVEETMENDAMKQNEERKLLDEMFEKTLAEEYGDDQLGELEDDDPDTRGRLLLEGELLDAILDDFVHVQQEILDEEGKVGNPLRTGNRLKEILAECEAERIAAEEEEGTEDQDVFPEEDAEETERQLRELFERNAYLQRREEEQWDCETIVSTYSNMDNHPTILREEPLGKKKKKKAKAITQVDSDTLSAAAMGHSKIVLSRKTGMPVGVLESKTSDTRSKTTPQDKENVPTESGSVMAPKRKGQESKEEKRARKEAVKQQKKERRQDKKNLKLAFKSEEQRQSHHLNRTAALGKVAVFK